MSTFYPQLLAQNLVYGRCSLYVLLIEWTFCIDYGPIVISPLEITATLNLHSWKMDSLEKKKQQHKT